MPTTRTLAQRIIVALDVDTRADAFDIIDKLGKEITHYKVGYQLFFREGMPIVGELIDRGKRVFLDLKLGDIGNTMRAGLSAIPDGVAMLTVQGDASVARAAVECLKERRDPPVVLLLTALSVGAENSASSRERIVVSQTRLAIDCGCGGVIASGAGIAQARRVIDRTGDKLKIIAPGIRLRGKPTHDQIHTMDPENALFSGADQLVIGRPLTQAEDVTRTLREIFASAQRGIDRLA